MSQIVACQNEHGIILATDGKAVEFGPGGEMIQRDVQRLVQIGTHAAILAGGAAESVDMAEALRQFIDDEGIEDIEEIYAAALPFLGTEYEKFMRKKCETIPLDPLHYIYFILAGYSATNLEEPFRMYMLWAKKKLPRLDGDDIGLVYAVPRRMGLEYELNQRCKESAPLSEILPIIRKNMEKFGKALEEVGGPFAYAVITRDGFREVG